MAAVDLTNLKAELKTWERSFRAENGREPEKNDMKMDPVIAQKYKQYRAQCKATTIPSSASSSSKSTLPPTTPVRKRPKEPTGSIIPKSRPVESEPYLATNNPFSPSKSRSSKGKSPEKSTFVLLSAMKSSSRAQSPDNPFVERSWSNSPTPMRKSVSFNNAYEEEDTGSASLPPPASFTTPRTQSRSFDFATSPRKLHSLIASTSLNSPRDTPRTKARKRMRGEDVSLTPSEKRQRKSSYAMSEDEDEDLEGTFATPVKQPLIGPKGKSFEPLFEDPTKVPLPSHSLFKKSTSSSSFTRALSSSKLGTKTLSSGSAMTNRETAPGGSLTRKRRSPDESEDVNIASAAASALSLNSYTSNPLALRAPSPPSKPDRTLTKLQGNLKGKGARKKSKTEASTSIAQADSQDDEEEEDGFDVVTWRPWGNLSQVDHTAPAMHEDSDGDGDGLLASSHARRALLAGPPSLLASGGDKVIIDLPEDMQQLLALDSADLDKQRKKEGALAENVLKGRDNSLVCKSGEIWGVGEVEGRATDDSDIDEWESEPEGWKGEAGLE